MLSLEDIAKKKQGLNLKNLSSKMGYKNERNFRKTLDKFLNSKSILKWLKNGNYDYVYSAKDFFVRLAKELDFTDDEILKTIKYYERYKKEADSFKGSYVFVNTNFKRISEPIHVLALAEQHRRFSLSEDENLYFKRKEEILKIISEYIKEHFSETRGNLGIWGKIADYQVHLRGEVFVFGGDGNMIEKEAVKLSEARLRA